MHLPEYTNIMRLAKAHDYHKLVVKRNTWGGSSCYVFAVDITPNGYGRAYGYTRYSDGSTMTGPVDNAGTQSWKVIRVLDEFMRGTITHADGSVDVIEEDGSTTHYNSKEEIPEPVCPKCGKTKTKKFNKMTRQDYWVCENQECSEASKRS